MGLSLYLTGLWHYLFMFFPFKIYMALVVFVVWFGISFINIQRERNAILTKISNKLEKED
ncbi:hypothetical protein [Alkalihalobacillus trypoxylicola]|uniref:Uncharacterized protein n=1 Tax=Alkalihalobacillus trypoxylicola TaxID=519424 RepID=A0A162DH17_9BACI|nr:hypothetical protein [Alkalihalobacillus trypoxylicola]KYG29607.1 hypothetical protein AZF04_08825 [Alkalihalobacillus trypoxylicola]